MNPAAGLCNGSHMLVVSMGENIQNCKLLTGERKGDDVLIPKITLKSGDGDSPFKLYRKQFPVKVCYAMTINKSQGQTIDFVGIDLSEPVFTHGQTYVAFSRVKSWNCLKVLSEKDKKNKIRNVVWPEVLLDQKLFDEEILSRTPTLPPPSTTETQQLPEEDADQSRNNHEQTAIGARTERSEERRMEIVEIISLSVHLL